MVADRIAQKTEMINEYLLRSFQICAFAILRYALFSNMRFCDFALCALFKYAIMRFCDMRFCDFCDMRFALLRSSCFCDKFYDCDDFISRYCDIAQQIADRNVADSRRRAIPRQSSHVSNPLCALMTILNDWIDY